MNFGAGRLKTPIVIRRATQIRNAKGGYDENWATIASCRAEVTGLDGREVMMAQALQGVSSYRLTLRWRAGIRVSDQVELPDGVKLNIQSMSDPDGNRRWLTLLADTGAVRAEV